MPDFQFIAEAIRAAALEAPEKTAIREQGRTLTFAKLCDRIDRFGLGPTAIALITDKVFGYEGAIRHFLAIVATLAMPIGLLVSKLGQKTFADEVKSMEAPAAGRA